MPASPLPTPTPQPHHPRLALPPFTLNIPRLRAAQTHQPPPFPLTALPTDLILSIADHLPPPSRLALALTNRALHAALPRSWLRLSAAQTLDWIDLLERGDPERRYFCFYSRGLHPLARLTNGGAQCGSDGGSGAGLKTPLRIAVAPTYSISLHAARAVLLARRMNSTHEHEDGTGNGNAFGLRLSTLNRKTNWYPAPDSAAQPRTESWTARVLDNELYVRSVQNLKVRQKDGEYDDEGHDKVQAQLPRVCHHTDLPTRHIVSFSDKRTPVGRAPRMRVYAMTPEWEAGSCARCRTDWEVTTYRVVCARESVYAVQLDISSRGRLPDAAAGCG
ncbi:Uu.00g021590.m01.CDS01 [Anthostomella pinea]|uniref:Uu.00g021590.m01.CDS01 n=1 Tax=Anthostomella pinea TaxID=933095 RepID=A0AAI8W0L8_9PEZI|nr:Uu.00g021590.m01.CDS01 [Anthostomella pinea]